MKVSPRAIIPFVYSTNKYMDDSILESKIIDFGLYLQKQLISRKASNILDEDTKTISNT